MVARAPANASPDKMSDDAMFILGFG